MITQLGLTPRARCLKVAQAELVSGSGLSVLRMARQTLTRDTQSAELVSSSTSSQHALTTPALMQTARLASLTGMLLFEGVSIRHPKQSNATKPNVQINSDHFCNSLLIEFNTMFYQMQL